MRGAFFVVILIALLIVGFLTIKDMNTEMDNGVQRKQAVEKAEQAAKQAEDATKKITKSVKNIQIPPIGQKSQE